MDLGTQVRAVFLYLISTLLATGEMKGESFSILDFGRKLLAAEGKKIVVIADVQVVICGAMILLTMSLSHGLKLGLTWDIAVAALRAGVQLVLLAYILVPVFANETLWSVSLILIGINTVGAREIYAQCERYYYKLYFESWVAIFVGWALPSVFCMAFVIKVDPWYRPQYIIPVVGLVLGNVLKCVQLAIDNYTLAMTKSTEVEIFLARGASPWEATRTIRARATRCGMTPTIQLMTIMGVVSIPGMMTGQIMGGTAPMLAAKYQIVLTLMICAACLVGIVLALVFVQRRLFTPDLRLDCSVLNRRNQKSKDIVTETIRFLVALAGKCLQRCRRPRAEHEPLLASEPQHRPPAGERRNGT